MKTALFAQQSVGDKGCRGVARLGQDLRECLLRLRKGMPVGLHAMGLRVHSGQKRGDRGAGCGRGCAGCRKTSCLTGELIEVGREAIGPPSGPPGMVMAHRIDRDQQDVGRLTGCIAHPTFANGGCVRLGCVCARRQEKCAQQTRPTNHGEGALRINPSCTTETARVPSFVKIEPRASPRPCEAVGVS